MRSIILFSILSFTYSTLSAQTVSTFLNSSLKVDDGMVLDDDGNLYGSHYSGSSVYKLTPDGNISTFATGFNTPNGLALNSKGELYVADNLGNRIYKLDANGNFLDTIFVNNPSGLIKDRDSDTILYTRYNVNVIGKLSPDGKASTWHQGSPLNGPVGLAYDEAGVLYVGNFNDRKVLRVREDDEEYVATIPGDAAADNWLGFITYAKGYIYGTSFNNHKIYRVNPSFIDSVEIFGGSSAGSSDGPLSEATFNLPNGILASPTGDTLYVSDFGTGRIRLITEFTTGLRDYLPASLEISIYPNPLDQYCQIDCSWEHKGQAKIEVLSTTGSRVYSNIAEVINGRISHRIATSNWSSGAYFLTISSENYRTTRVLIKK